MTEPRPIRSAIERTIEVPRTARYCVLGADGGEANELWFVLHGFGQLARDFIHYFGDLADGRRLVIAPEALNRYYAASASVPAKDRAVGATWMTREDRENEIKDYVRYLDLLHSAVAASQPGARTIVVGFSQGGATASRWAIHGSARIDRLILWGGEVPPDLDLTRLRVPSLALVYGTRDQFFTPKVVAANEARLREHKIGYDLVAFDGGHEISEPTLLQVAGARV